MSEAVETTTDVVVVGAGIVGLAIARDLGKRGAEVLVLERDGVGSGQSGLQRGASAVSGGTAVGCRLSSEAVALWRDAERSLGIDLLPFRECGYLFLAHSPTSLARLRSNVDLQNAAGIPSRIVTPAEAAGLAPGLQAEGIEGAAWCGEDGYFDDPAAVLAAFTHGVTVRIAEVTGLRQQGSAVRVVTRSGSIRAGAVVVAAGAASARLLASLDVALPIVDEERHLFLSEPIERRILEPLVVSTERGLAAKQLADGRLLASDLTARGRPADGEAAWRVRLRNGLRELLPPLEHIRLTTLITGVYDMTPDAQPILGPLAILPNVHLAAGFSGHGFMIAPAVARIVADAIEGRFDPILDVLDAGRFAREQPVLEPEIV